MARLSRSVPFWLLICSISLVGFLRTQNKAGRDFAATLDVVVHLYRVAGPNTRPVHPQSGRDQVLLAVVERHRASLGIHPVDPALNDVSYDHRKSRRRGGWLRGRGHRHHEAAEKHEHPEYSCPHGALLE